MVFTFDDVIWGVFSSGNNDLEGLDVIKSLYNSDDDDDDIIINYQNVL